MSRNLLFLLFTNFLLAQCWQLTLSAPTAESTQPQTSAVEVQLTPRIQLLADIFRKTSPLFPHVIDSGSLFQIVLWKSKKPEHPLTTPFASTLTAYFEKINKLIRSENSLQREIRNNSQFINTEQGQKWTAEVLVKFLEATSDYADIVEQYNALPQQSEGDDALIKTGLEDSGFPQMAVHFDKTFSSLQAQTLVDLERYFAALSAEEFAQESRLNDWYKQLKGAAVPKVQTFVKFSEFFSVQEIGTVAKFFKKK